MKKVLRAIGAQIPLLLVLLVGSLPWWSSLDYWPQTNDIPTWLAGGAMSSSEWATWVFRSDHFGWYRPLTALSFTIMHATSGLEPVGYRVFDLAFHLAAACLCLGLLRWLVPTLPRRALLLAALLFLAHPATEQVVPFMSRVGFSLALFFGLGGLAILARELRTVPVGRAAGSLFVPATLVGLLLVGALFSHEGAVVFVALAPLLAAHVAAERGLPHRTWLVPAAVPALLVGLALAWRHLVLGGVGGAPHEGVAALLARPDRSGAWLDSLGSLFALPALERNLGAFGQLLGYVALAAGVLLLARAVLLAATRWSAPGERTLFGLGAWVLATLGLFLFSETWAPRHTYLVQVPMVLLVVAMLGTGARAHAEADGARATEHPLLARAQLAAAALVALAWVLASPVLHGQDPGRRAAERSAIIENLIGGMNGIERPVVVHVALPDLSSDELFAGPGDVDVTAPDAARQPIGWANLVLSEKDITLVDVVYYPFDSGTDAFHLERPDRRAAFVAAEGEPYLLRGRSGFDHHGPESDRRVELLPYPAPIERGVYAMLCSVERADVKLVRVPIQNKESLGAEYLPAELFDELDEPVPR